MPLTSSWSINDKRLSAPSDELKEKKLKIQKRNSSKFFNNHKQYFVLNLNYMRLLINEKKNNDF